MSDAFTDVDLSGGASPRHLGAKPLALVGGLVAFAAVVWYSAAVDPLPYVAGARRIDLLFVAAAYVFLVYGVVPLAAAPGRARPVVEYASTRPLVAVSVLWILGFVVVGLVSPLFIDLSFDLDAVHQAPVFASVDTTYTTDCVGTVVGDRCYGTWAHPLGTTAIGRDVLTLVLYGMREALVFATIVAALLVPVATVVGVVAGYRGGLTDELLMWFVDVQQTLPAFVVYLVAKFLYGESQFLLVLVFGLTSWGGVARIVRNETLELRGQQYVRAAVGAGAGTPLVLRKHVLPNLSGAVVTSVTRQIPMLLLVEAALSYMDLTVVTSGSWGRTIYRGMEAFPDAWWVSTAPVVTLCVTVVAFSVLGDALRDVFDPRTEA